MQDHTNVKISPFSACCCIPLQLPLISSNKPKVLVPIRRYHYQHSCQKNNQIAGQKGSTLQGGGTSNSTTEINYCSRTLSVYLFIRQSDCWPPPTVTNLNHNVHSKTVGDGWGGYLQRCKRETVNCR
jgi:hypothetical protein